MDDDELFELVRRNYSEANKEYIQEQIRVASEYKAMMITVELELSSPYDLTAEEIEKDLRMAEDQIGWTYDYAIKSVEVT